MKTIAQVLEGKSAPIATIEADETVLDALKVLAERGIGAYLRGSRKNLQSTPSTQYGKSQSTHGHHSQFPIKTKGAQ